MRNIQKLIPQTDRKWPQRSQRDAIYHQNCQNKTSNQHIVQNKLQALNKNGGHCKVVFCVAKSTSTTAFLLEPLKTTRKMEFYHLSSKMSKTFRTFWDPPFILMFVVNAPHYHPKVTEWEIKTSTKIKPTISLQ